MADTEDYEEGGAAGVHHTTHENGGSDEVTVQGLSGTLADDQPSTWTLVTGKPSTFAPEAHKTSHQHGGTDEISVTGLSGTLADDQHVIDSEVLAVAEDKTKKGAASGYAELDSTTKVPIAQMASGTPDGTKFIRDDRTLAVPTAGGITTGKAIAMAMVFG